MLTIETHYNGYNFAFNGEALAPIEITSDIVEKSDASDLISKAMSSKMPIDMKYSAVFRIHQIFNIKNKLDVVIHARRWFNRKEGNTYHTVSVMHADSTKGNIIESGIRHGYGEEYLQTVKDGFIPILPLENSSTHHEAPRIFLELNGINIVEENVIDVKRKMDL